MPATKRPRPITPPTEQQERALLRIIELTEANGYPPSVAELSKKLGLRTIGGAMNLVKALVKKGYLSKAPGVARGLRVLKRPAKRAK